MTAEIKKASQTIENFFGNCPNANAKMINDKYIPSRLLKKARGLAFLTVFKAGFLFSGRFGTGLFIGKNYLLF
jgi:lipid-binding SYLF domain-containing protein